MMRILITGASGFIGHNLIAQLLRLKGSFIIYPCDESTSMERIEKYTRDCDFVYHLAAVHRPKDEKAFHEVNYVYFQKILQLLIKNGNNCPVVYTSSIQAVEDTAYGRSKLEAEEALRRYEKITGGRAIIYRLTNTFGRWAKPNNHSVVATFCYNISKNLPIQISNSNQRMNFYYIGDVIESLLGQLENKEKVGEDGFYGLKEDLLYTTTLGELAGLLYYFKLNQDKKLEFQEIGGFEEKLYLTYLSYAYEDTDSMEI